MSERDVRRKKIRAEIDRIKAQKENATRQLQKQEYVHLQQITAKRRLFKDLDERLVGLWIQYDALKEEDVDE